MALWQRCKERQMGAVRKKRMSFNEYPLADLNVSNIPFPGKCVAAEHPITFPTSHRNMATEAECVFKKALLYNIMRSRRLICRDCWSSGQICKQTSKNSSRMKNKQEMFIMSQEITRQTVHCLVSLHIPAFSCQPLNMFISPMSQLVYSPHFYLLHWKYQ